MLEFVKSAIPNRRVQHTQKLPSRLLSQGVAVVRCSDYIIDNNSNFFSNFKNLINNKKKEDLKMTKKFNITDEKFPLTELNLDMNQFELPNVWRADFSKAKINHEAEYINGQRHDLENISSIVVPAFDDTVLTALEKMNVSVSSLKNTEIEFIGDFINIEKQIEREKNVKIKLNKPQIRLKNEVVNRKSAKRGEDKIWYSVIAINSVKMVAEGFQLVADE